MIEQNFTAFNSNQLPLLQQTSTVPVSVSGSSVRQGPQSEDSQSGQQDYTGATQPNYNSSNAGSPTFTTNYAMSQQMSQQASYTANAINPGEFGMYRSSYLHSHAKPPYSYISLIAMAIQVIVFLDFVTEKDLRIMGINNRLYLGITTKNVHVE